MSETRPCIEYHASPPPPLSYANQCPPPPPPPPLSNNYSSHIRECPKTTRFEERKGEWNRGPFAAYQPNALPLVQTGSPIQVSGIDRGFIRILQCRYRTISFHCFSLSLSHRPPPPPQHIHTHAYTYVFVIGVSM